MAKHKAKKKSIKRRVQKRAAKLKELTAQDLFMNQELLYSPQFKALPLERQFQLTSQLKQLRMMAHGGMGAPVPSNPNNGGDNSLYHRYMEATNKLQKAQNANEQLRIGLQTTTDALKHETELKKEIKEASEREKEEVKRKAKIEALTSTLQHLKEKNIDEERAHLESEIKDYQQKFNIQKLEDKQKELAKVKAQRNMIEQVLGYQTNPDEYVSLQGTYQNQINSYNENGRFDKAQLTEQILHSFSSNEPYTESYPEFQSNLQNQDIPFTAPNPPLQPTMPPTIPTHSLLNFQPSDELKETIINHNEALIEHQLNNEKENINNLQSLKQSEKEANEAYIQVIQPDRNFEADDLSSKTLLAQNKTAAFNELKAFLETVEDRNPSYNQDIANAIKEADNGAIISAIRQKIKADTALYNEAMEDQEKIKKGKKELISDVNNPMFDYEYIFAPNIWIAKINQIRTYENLNDMSEMLSHAHTVQKARERYSNVGDSYHFWSSEQIKRDVDRKKYWEAQKDKLLKWLEQDFPKKKVKVFYDSADYTNLPQHLLNKSPSLRFKWEDNRNYTIRTYGNDN